MVRVHKCSCSLAERLIGVWFLLWTKPLGTKYKRHLKKKKKQVFIMVIRIKTSRFVASRARSFVASRARSFVASRARRQGIDKNSLGRVCTNKACLQISHNYYSLIKVRSTPEVNRQTHFPTRFCRVLIFVSS